MRIQFVITVLAGLCLLGCAAGKGYRIVGEADGVQDGMAYLTVRSGDQTDTLSSAVIRDGRFEFSGECPEVTPALLTLGRHSVGGIMLFLENRRYRINIDPERIDRSEVSGGGEAQRIADGYRLCAVENSMKVDDIRDEFMSLRPGDSRFHELAAYVDSLQQDQERQRAEYLQKHADSYLAMEILAADAPRRTAQGLREAYERFSPVYRQGLSGEYVAMWIERLEKNALGKVAPDAVIADPQGNDFTVHSVKGSVKLIEFWASWCAPCRKMIPELKQLYGKYHEQGFEILSISLDDDRENWLRALEVEQMSWPQGSDLLGFGKEVPLVKAFGIFGIPHSVLVDGENRILSERFSGMEELEKMIVEHLDYKK